MNAVRASCDSSGLKSLVERGWARVCKISDGRHADHPIEPMLLNRWSPRRFTGAEIGDAQLAILFEAARWAPSSFNHQPWRMLYARRGGPHWEGLMHLLTPSNARWASGAGLLLLFLSELRRSDGPSRTHSFDTGAAWQNLALQATALGLAARGIEGFDYERARVELNVPGRFSIDAMAAVGVRDMGAEPPALSSRRSIWESVQEGPFPAAATSP